MGLELAWKRGFKNLIVQDGNKTVADALQGLPLKSKQGSSLARHILHLLQHFKEVRFIHIFRETIKCADFLAKLYLSNFDGCI